MAEMADQEEAVAEDSEEMGVPTTDTDGHQAVEAMGSNSAEGVLETKDGSTWTLPVLEKGAHMAVMEGTEGMIQQERVVKLVKRRRQAIRTHRAQYPHKVEPAEVWRQVMGHPLEAAEAVAGGMEPGGAMARNPSANMSIPCHLGTCANRVAVEAAVEWQEEPEGMAKSPMAPSPCRVAMGQVVIPIQA